MLSKRYIPISTACGFLAGLFYGMNAFTGMVGAVMGSMLDIFYKKIFIPRQNERLAQQNFSFWVTSLAAKIAKADGVISKEEVAALKKNAAYSVADSKIVGAIFNEAGISELGYEDYITKLRAFFFTHPAQRVKSLKLLYTVAYAGALNTKQADILYECAFQWGVSQEDVRKIEETMERPKTRSSSSQQQQEKDTPFTDNGDQLLRYRKLLGVKEGVTPEELKSAYKKLIRKHHPDVLRGQGKSEKEIAKGEDKLQALNEAYDTLKKKL